MSNRTPILLDTYMYCITCTGFQTRVYIHVVFIISMLIERDQLGYLPKARSVLQGMDWVSHIGTEDKLG